MTLRRLLLLLAAASYNAAAAAAAKIDRPPPQLLSIPEPSLQFVYMGALSFRSIVDGSGLLAAKKVWALTDHYLALVN